jgi:hypothetical protein
MSPKKLFTVLAAATMLAVSAPAFAQEDAAPRKAEMQQRIRALRHKMLVKKAGLSEAKVAKVEETIDSFAAERAKLKKTISEEKKTLQELLRQDSNDQASYEGAIARLRAAQKQMQELRDREFAALQQNLTGKEQARLLHVLAKVRHKAQKKLIDRHGRPGKKHGRRHAAEQDAAE